MPSSNRPRSARPTIAARALIVSGCLPQRFREELPKLLPEVDAFMGIDQVAQVRDIVQKAIELRGDKLRESHGPGRAPKSKVVQQIAEAGQTTAAAHDHEEKLRGTNRFGKTRIALHARPRPHRSSMSTPRPNFIPDFATPRFRLTPRHFAYVKIAEGCNHPCSFCIIPRMRGSHRSRAADRHRRGSAAACWPTASRR